MLETVWLCIWGFLWAVYFMLDGFDLGLGVLQPVLAQDDGDRKAVYLAMGPFWDGNEVWLVAAGAVTFAAFPVLYAVMFSSFYSLLMLILFALILRAVSIELGEEARGPVWKAVWRGCLALGSFLTAFLFGVVFANIFRGIPIDGEGIYHGTFLTLFSPYALVGGLLFFLLFLLHGALWLAVKTDGPLQVRSVRSASRIWPAALVAAAAFLILTAFQTELYAIYLKRPVLVAIPLIAVAALFMTRVWIERAECFKAWVASCASIFSIVMFGVVGLYPLLLPSSLSATFSLTAYGSASSPMALKIMLGVVLVFIPIIAVYQGWVYRFFGGKVDVEAYTKH
ncbi:MAG: cytochrome d ubiquinol oxidase subunit II [Syntrophales bacterium]|nr:cytochrome d ubiquinol oxidase subunit II [Syntrophales bacterium]